VVRQRCHGSATGRYRRKSTGHRTADALDDPADLGHDIFNSRHDNSDGCDSGPYRCPDLGIRSFLGFLAGRSGLVPLITANCTVRRATRGGEANGAVARSRLDERAGEWQSRSRRRIPSHRARRPSRRDRNRASERRAGCGRPGYAHGPSSPEAISRKSSENLQAGYSSGSSMARPSAA
jgi:hypothetical protein